jgi:hypothetical protein
MSSSVHPGLPLAYAERLAALLVERLTPGCARIEVAGSVRRQKATVKDVELVCIPKRDPTNRLEMLLNVLLTTYDRPIFRSRCDLLIAMGKPVDAGPDLRRWGERYKRFYLWANDRYGIVAVDLFLATVNNWGAIFAIRTGPDDFSKALVTHIKYRTPYQQRDGVLVRQVSGEVVPVREEKEYFRLAGVPWIAPERRTPGALKTASIATPTTTVKALSLWQPWASLIAAGLKQYETRSWATPYRGLLAIHAAKRQPDVDVSDLLHPVQAGRVAQPLPLGAVVCVVDLVDVVPTTGVRETLSKLEYRVGDYSPGRWAWKLELVRAFETPIPARGAQGLWDWEVDRATVSALRQVARGHA